MKKITLITLLFLIISGCASKPPQAPEPVGEFTPVNPDNINIEELKL